jgi:hypothetical protein
MVYWKVFVDCAVIDTDLNSGTCPRLKVVGVLVEIQAQDLSSTSNKIYRYINSMVLERGI